MKNLQRKSVVAYFWNLTGSLIDIVLTLAIGFLLARILNPEIFGFMAMIYVIFEISEVMVRGGLREALIREKDLREEDLATVFWVNFLIAVGLIAILFFTAPYVARFFEEPILTNLVRFMSLSILFRSMMIVPQAQLTHALDFKKLKLIKTSTLIISSGIAIYMALNDYGVWSLAVRFISQVFLGALIYFLVLRWIPKSFIQKESFTRLFSFGGRMMLSSILDKIVAGSYSIIIGKLYATESLGKYSQANNIQVNTSKSIVDSIQQIVFPAFSKRSDDKENLKKNFEMIFLVVSFLVFPLVLSVWCYSEPLIELLLGPKWSGTERYLDVLLVVASTYHFISLNKNILKVLGESKAMLNLEFYKKGFMLLGLLIGSFFGLYGVIWGQATSALIMVILAFGRSKKFLDLDIPSLLKEHLRIAISLLPILISWLFFYFFCDLEFSAYGFIVFGTLGFGGFLLVAKLIKLEQLQIIINLGLKRGRA